MRVGREAQREELRDWVRAGARGRGGRLVVEGEPGAGRTAYVREALAEAGALGLRVRYAAAEPFTAELPLRAALDCLHPEGADRAAVIDLLREAREARRPGGAWLAAMDLMVSGVGQWCARGPVLLVLDDVHWADPASLLLWRRLGREADRLPLRLAVTRRPLPRRPEVEQLCAGLGAGPAGHTVRLEPLTGPESEELLHRLLGAPPGPRLRRAAAQAGGNPALLRELTAHWSRLIETTGGAGAEATTGDGDGDRDGGGDGDGDGDGGGGGGGGGGGADDAPVGGGPVAELVLPEAELPQPPRSLTRGLGYLSRAAYTTLRHAALLGPAFTPRELALVRGRPAREVLDELEEPLLAALLEDSGEQLRFRHPALRRALYAELPRAARSALHQEAAAALAAAGHDPARTAEQLLAGGPLERWAVHWLADSAQPLIAAAPEAAAELLERAVGRAGREDRDALEGSLADAALMLRRPESAELLATLHERAEDPGARAELAFKLVSALMIQGDMGRALAVTEDALAEPVPSPALRLRLEACRVLALAERGSPAQAHALAVPVVARAARLGDPLCGAEAHHAMAFALFHLGRGRESLRHVAEGIAWARRGPEANDMRLLLLANQAEGHASFDEPEPVAAALREARELALATGSTGRLVVTEVLRAEFDYRLGDWDAALAGVDRADGLPVSDNWLPVVVHGLRALVRGHRDEREAARAELARLPQAAFEAPAARRYSGHVLLARALVAERAGDPAGAVRELLPALADGPQEARAYERPWMLSEIVRLALECGDSATARTAVAACRRTAAALAEYPGPALALLRCEGLFAQDPQLLTRALERAERGGRPLVLGHAWEDLAVARAWHGDLAAARSALARAVAAYEALGARWDVARADARLRSLGVRRGSRSARRRVANGWEALTPAELKVALLVAQGRSNPEIASALFLSARTVQTHVSHILAKLQVRSRAAVAAQAAARRSGPQAAPGPPP
ncbi:LuxR C-terminal-related transcriptional regulator [Streptomyces vinaceus]|uniref:LuxR C-terminal-related transcriptional regulator n=1 Tax=Streptomyces vinaceus TaxID=1960 RepID=UPI00142ED74E|nr:LuxR family transcriptional regulator [Streptomyces vinaceus]GHE68629.1 LuxR family transcriptional regulator [Streptomyces vinaceus]